MCSQEPLTKATRRVARANRPHAMPRRDRARPDLQHMAASGGGAFGHRGTTTGVSGSRMKGEARGRGDWWAVGDSAINREG